MSFGFKKQRFIHYPGKKKNAVSKRVFKQQQKRKKTLFKV
jgi:hypothetical protein